ncbi:class I SAM-dependent methyltransferase [Pseudonocardia sp. GCM10023141]|uniref:class I SAM-dependent methyltransferase n=1 Tax=Pseudonocardia sp. GCM10023141 TaxID=3252653 RepID=UPI003621701B
MAARIPTVPPLLAATESWPPNAAVARRNLAPLGVAVAEVADDAPLPYPDATFDLVVSRYPVSTPWPEIARVLRPGGTFLSQQIGAGTNHALSEALMGPLPVGAERSTERAVTAAEAAGLEIIDLRTQSLRVTFDDVGAVVHFLRKVLWTVPGLTVDGYREQLAALHERIQAGGPFVSQSERFLIEARKPG